MARRKKRTYYKSKRESYQRDKRVVKTLALFAGIALVLLLVRNRKFLWINIQDLYYNLF